jgi:hypothetical protein
MNKRLKKKNKAKKEIHEIQDDYYLLSFSNEELIDVIEKSDEKNEKLNKTERIVNKFLI